MVLKFKSFPAFNFEYLVVDVDFVKHVTDSFALGVGDKNLPKAVFAGKFYNLFYPIIVEFIKNIVEEHHRFVALQLLDILVLCEPDGEDEGFLLALRAKLFYGVTFQVKNQVVFVNSGGRVSHNPVFPDRCG